ncbi:hypothetical protein [Halalkalibacter oceani]
MKPDKAERASMPVMLVFAAMNLKISHLALEKHPSSLSPTRDN